MKVFVISGGPGTGKTTAINELSKEFRILPEGARYVGENDLRFKGKGAKNVDINEFQKEIFDFQREYLEKLDKNDKSVIFSDRGLGDTIAYYYVHGLEPDKKLVDYAKKFRYDIIFIFELIDFYEQDELRNETRVDQEKIQKEIIKTYEQLGYKPIFVPFMPVKERVSFIKSRILDFL